MTEPQGVAESPGCPESPRDRLCQPFWSRRMSTPPQIPQVLCFDLFELDTRAGELRKRGRKLKLQGQPLQVLAALLRRPGELVTRNELRAEIWHADTFVDFDHSLHNAIARIRETLGDSADEPRFIETLPRRGYRFIGEVQRDTGEASSFKGHFVALPHHPAIIGRVREIEEVCQALRCGSVRLLTLTGVGGAGKTTLALASASKMIQDFSDGMVFIDLAEVKTPNLVITSIAQPLGLKEGDARPILEVVKDYFRSKTMLLILDNFEQVLAAGALVAELLAAAPALKVLVTSRSLLHITAEREYVVPPLTISEQTGEGTPDELLRYDAVKLFVDRACAVRPNFVLTAENAPAVSEICMRLDGLPLAIELAAARIKVLSPHEILKRLDKRLRLLTGGATDLPARLRTMRGALDSSYELLTEAEKRVFSRLGVFAGSFSLSSVEWISQRQSGHEEEPQVLDFLTSLLNQSLILSELRNEGDVRFRMLGVVREYALDRLEATGEADAIRKLHAEHFLGLAEAAEPSLQGTQSAGWLNRLDEEYDNLRAALHWSMTNDFAMAVRFNVALRNYWEFMGQLAEGLGILRQILSHSERIAPKQRLTLYSMAGNLAKFQGDYQTAHGMYERGLAEARGEGDLSDVSLLCRGLGSLAAEQGDHPTARRFIEEALEAARKATDPFGLARSLSMLGDVARSEGDDRIARDLYRQALTACRETNRKYAIANILNNLAAAEYGCGHYDSAQAYFVEALQMTHESVVKMAGDRVAISYSLDGFAALAVHRGEIATAATLAGAAQRLRESMNFNIEPAERRFRDAYLASLRDLLAEQPDAAAFEKGQRLNLDESIVLALRTSRVNPSNR